MMTDHAVTLVNDSLLEFNVMFHGPKDSTLVHLLRAGGGGGEGS